MRGVRALAQRLFGIDGRSLAAFRIGIGSLVLADLWTRSAAIEQHYSDAGVLPRDAYARLLAVSPWQWSVHFVTGSVAGQSALFLFATVAACALIAGYRTRAATIVTWAMLVSLQARNPMVLYGADQLLRVMLFWSMFLPLGCVWAFDRYKAPSPLAPSRHVSTATAALLLQPCVMYLFAGLLKWNDSWQSGSALGYALAAETYATGIGRMLGRSPALVAALGRLVPWIEILAPIPLLLPWRTATVRMVTLVLLAGFHAAMGLSLHTGLFQPVAVVALIPFLPTGFWERVGTGHPRTANAGIPAPASTTTRARWFSMVQQTLVGVLFAYVLAWNVVGLSTEQYAAQHNLAWMQEWWRAGRTGVPLSFRDYAIEREMGNIGWIGRVFALYQRWDMFESVGPEIRGWPVIVGTLGDGRKVSVLDERAVDKDAAQVAPAAPLSFYPGARWLVYFTYLRTPGTKPARELLPAVVTRDWDRRNPGSKLVSMRIAFVTAGDGSTSGKSEVWYDGMTQGNGLGQ